VVKTPVPKQWPKKLAMKKPTVKDTDKLVAINAAVAIALDTGGDSAHHVLVDCLGR
jgi:hypothetical protein